MENVLEDQHLMPRMHDGPLKAIAQLVQNERVQDELYLSRIQIRELNAALSKIRQELTGAVEKALDHILPPEQYKRLKEIRLQMQGFRAFGDAEIQSQLQLTDDQREQIRAVIRDGLQKEAETMQKSLGNHLQEVRQHLTEVREKSLEQVVALLTDEQKAQWEEGLGEAFEFAQDVALMRRGRPEIRGRGPGRARPGRGGPRRGAGGSVSTDAGTFPFTDES